MDHESIYTAEVEAVELEPEPELELDKMYFFGYYLGEDYNCSNYSHRVDTHRLPPSGGSSGGIHKRRILVLLGFLPLHLA